MAALKLAAQSQRETALAPEWQRYEDPTTEIAVVRLTDPAHSSTLPAYYNRALTRSSSGLLFASDRTGQPQAFRIDLKTGEARQLAEAAELDAASLALLPDSRSYGCFAGRSLLHVNLGTLRQRELYQIPDAWQRCPGMSLTPDGAHALFAERRGEGSRLRSVSLAQGAARTVIEAKFSIEHPLARPAATRFCTAKAPKRSGWWMLAAPTTAASSWRRAALVPPSGAPTAGTSNI